MWQSYKEEAKKQRYIIQTLERERDHYGKDAATAQQSCIVQMEEVKTKEMQLYQLKKKIAESESKLKQQQVCGLSPHKSPVTKHVTCHHTCHLSPHITKHVTTCLCGVSISE